LPVCVVLTLCGIAIRAFATEPISGYTPPAIDSTDINEADYESLLDIPRQAVRGLRTTVSADPLPASFDWRTENPQILVAARDQNPYGSCWAFAATAVMEGSAVQNGLTATSIMLSPKQLVYAAYNSQTFETPAGYSALNAGGNSLYSAAALGKWFGPVDEARVPYGTSTAITDPAIYAASDYHLREMRMLPMPKNNTTAQAAYSAENVETIKRAVKTWGPVATAFYWGNYWKSSTNSPYNSTVYYYCNNSHYNPADPYGNPLGVNIPNHAVVIVGWDDSISRTNFNTNIDSQPPGDGAWLIRNSWGPTFGQAGYFWMSYYDKSMDTSEYFSIEDVSNYDHNYYWDAMGWIGGEIENDGDAADAAQIANVFTSTATTTVAQELRAVSFYTDEPDTDYEIAVYLNPTDGSPTGPLQADVADGAALTITGNKVYAGLYTVDLDIPVYLPAGQTFSVVVTLSRTDGVDAIPVEASDSGTTLQGDPASGLLSTGVDGLDIAPGQSYYRFTAAPGDSSPVTDPVWTDVYDTVSAPNSDYADCGNVNVKALTVDTSATAAARYTIGFDSCGGTSVPATTIASGAPYGTLPTPTRAGCDFLGWFTESVEGTQVTAATTATENRILYAHWGYVITFDARGHSADTTVTLSGGHALTTLPADITRAGYTFAGWWTEPDGGFPIAAGIFPAGSTAYYARWTCTITYDARGGSSTPATQTVFDGATVTLPTATRAGYTFGGWWTAATAGSQVGSDWHAGGDITLHAHWNSTVSFDVNGGDTATTPPPIVVAQDSAYGPLPTAMRAGYTFDGWYTAPGGGVRVGSDDYPAGGDATLYARWVSVVVWDARGFSTDTTRAVAFGSAVGTLPADVTRAGYTFAGWWTAADGGTQVTAAAVPPGNVTYYARWTCTVSFDTHGGTAAPALTVFQGQSVTLPAVSRVSYSFAGWWTDATGGTQLTGSYTPAGDITLHAHWCSRIVLNANGGITPVTTQLLIADGDAYGALPTTTRIGYTFGGWWTDATGGTQVQAGDIATGNRTLYAHWLSTVTFNARGGSAVAARTVDYGQPLGALPSGVTRAGYTFGGWWTAADGGTQVTAATVPTGDVTYYARWTWTVSFDTRGGSTVSALTRYDNQTAAPGNPTKPGYTFDGWWTAGTGGTRVATPIAAGSTNGSITLYAHWGSTVTWDARGGSTVGLRLVPEGSAIGSLPTPTRTKARLLGWYTLPAGNGVQVDAGFVPNGNTQLYAHWMMQVAFNTRGGSSVSTTEIAQGSVIGTLPVTTRAGYVFAGWSTDGADSGGGIIDAGFVVYDPLTLYARWTAIGGSSQTGGSQTGQATTPGGNTGTSASTTQQTVQVAKPKRTAIKKLTVGKRKVTVTWKKVGSISKYQLRYRIRGKKAWKYKLVSAKQTKLVLKKLKRAKRYQIQVRSYCLRGSKRLYSPWSATKTTKRVR
jgi:uncharacterized repeat protein (TIGR02543 family)